MDPQTLESWLGKVLYYLSFRVRSRREITDYLNKKGATKEEIKIIMARVDDLRLVDDSEFIRQLINARLAKGYGSKKIHFDLLNKGISPDQVKTALAALSLSAWTQSAIGYLDKKYSAYTLQPNAFRKEIFRILSAKGHDGRVIARVIDDLTHPE